MWAAFSENRTGKLNGRFGCATQNEAVAAREICADALAFKKTAESSNCDWQIYAARTELGINSGRRDAFLASLALSYAADFEEARRMNCAIARSSVLR